MTNQPNRRGWGVLALIVPWGIIGMAVNLTQGSASPAMIWVWAAAACIASTIAIAFARKLLRRIAP
jgi:hypothetical protein